MSLAWFCRSTPGHVEADGVTEDMVERLLDRDVGAARLHGDHQLHLVVQVLGGRRIGDLGRVLGVGADDDGVGRLGEEEGWLAVGIVPISRAWAA
jgi:hypothetical protein